MKRLWARPWLLPALALMVAALPLGAADLPGGRAGRLVAVVLDTSTSMREAVNDQPRLAIQALKILTDLLGSGDDLTLAWMPASPDCAARPDPARRLDRPVGDLEGFKRTLDERARYGGPTNFIVPLLAVKEALDAAPQKERLLIVVSDAGRDTCRAESNRVLAELRAAGVNTALVELGVRGRPVHTEYDILTAAQNPGELLAAIGEIYQRFLGAKAPASGRLSPDATAIAAEVAPFVDQAFLLVAAEGPVGALSPAPGNPAAATVDPGYRAGETLGLDGVTRGYRILRLERPTAGLWRFAVEGLTGEAGWYLIQDFSVSLRVTPLPQAAQGEDTLVTAELIDDRTGERIRDPDQLPGLDLKALTGGTEAEFRDDGREGDAAAGDGLLTARVRFTRVGTQELRVRLKSRYLADEQRQETRISPAAWTLEVLTPPDAVIDTPVRLAVRVRAPRAATGLRPPERVSARLGEGMTLDLVDDGRAGDQNAGDGVYARDWTPRTPGDLTIDYRTQGEGEPAETQGRLAVQGSIAFGPPGVLDYGRLTGRSQGEAPLDLGFVEARGRFDLALRGDFDHSGAVLEIDPGDGFRRLADRPITLTVGGGRPRPCPVRLRVGRCPAAVAPDTAGALVVEALDPSGRTLQARVPIRVEIVPDHWLRCWWPLIAAVLGLLLGLFVLYGILSPARFPRPLAVVLSPEADMDEGYPFNIRGQKGARAGFYRDARIHISADFQLRRSAAGALARLRADRLGVFIQPVGGSQVLYQDADRRWEPLPTDHETRVRFSTLYRNGVGSLYFEFRNLG